ncbi:MAG TPA: DUF1786 domain-containing protein [Thermomicrobiales bacterium]|nr:DUF1786 domain-containing protein [Thermomicrobiales bacterium]
MTRHAEPANLDPLRILAVDVGGGTQDVLIYDSSRAIENCVKLVLPSQTHVTAARVRRATRAGRDVYLAGSVMGGGASSEAILQHITAGLRVCAAPEPARTLHNDIARVQAMGVELRDTPPPGAEVIRLCDVDIDGLAAALTRFGVELPSIYAIAVQDHGYLPDAGGREFRYEYLQSLLRGGGEARDMIFREPPDYMIRMRAVTRDLPGAVVMDTGAAAVLGSLGDPLVAARAGAEGAVLVNVGNMHTFAAAFRGDRIHGQFEHHTGGITPELLARLVGKLAHGTLTEGDVELDGGHGAAFGNDYAALAPYPFVAITGPNRRIATGLGYHEAAPHGDMMLSGAFGLVDGCLQLLRSEGYHLPATSLHPDS